MSCRGPLRALFVSLGAVACWTAAAGQETTEPPPREVVLGKPSAIRGFDAAAETVLVAAGTRLYALPDRRSTLVSIVGAEAPRPVIERAAGWVMVRIEGQGGWAAAAGGRTGPEIVAPADMDYLALRREPLAPLPRRLERAWALLGGAPGREAGPFTVYTDLADPGAIDWIVGLVTRLPAVYGERYGVEPAAGDRFAVVIFADEASYRAFERQDRELAGLEAAGHAAGNIAAIYAAGRDPSQLAPILLHELTHLVNRSVFRGHLPAWLEEGLAEDLSLSRVDDAGRVDAKRLGGVDRRYVELAPDGSRTYVTELWGAPATLSRLVAARRAGRLPALPDLMALSRRDMMRLDGRPLRYGQSAFFVRYLLEGAGSEGRAGLRRFLAATARGGGADPEELTAQVGRDWDHLERGYGRWLAGRASALGGRNGTG